MILFVVGTGGPGSDCPPGEGHAHGSGHNPQLVLPSPRYISQGSGESKCCRRCGRGGGSGGGGGGDMVLLVSGEVGENPNEC